jgi:hypothetical protein
MALRTMALARAAMLLLSPSLLLLPMLAAPLRPHLQLIEGQAATIANASSPGSRGNVHGYEDGSVRRVGNVTHMLVSELYGNPVWVAMRLAHWRTSAPAGDSGWQRVGTLQLDGAPMVSTANCSDKIDHTAALWSPVAFYEGGSWFMTYVAYDCPRNIDGQIKLTKSTVAGPTGIGGPYASVPGVGPLLARGAAGGNASQPWEKQQGDDSFFPFHAPPAVAAPQPRRSQPSIPAAAATATASPPPPPPPLLLAFYGSSPFGWPWNVGLARSRSGQLRGPWERLASNPVLVDGSECENPVVLQVARPDGTPVLLMLHDWVLHGRSGFGMSWSVDGLSWANSTMVAVPGGCEAPMGVLPALRSGGGDDAAAALAAAVSGGGSSSGGWGEGATQLTIWWNRRGRYDNLFAGQFVLSWR